MQQQIHFQGEESITLYCQDGGSDKVYKAELKAETGGFILNGWNGRRGSALKLQPKLAAPTTYEVAKKEYDSLVRSKMKKGYHAGDAAADYVAANLGERSEMALHLLSPVSEAEIERYLADDRFCAQQKFDGERRPVARRESVIGGNRNGFTVSMPKHLIDALGKLPANTELDTEQVGDTLFVFDVMKIAGDFQHDQAYLERMRKVEVLLRTVDSEHVVAVDTAVGSDQKRALYARLRATRQEGIVFKNIDSSYSVGQNDDQIKIKFVERATLAVASVHPSKRSVAVQAFGSDGAPLLLGNVTVPANYPIPSQGEIIEVEYLYVVAKMVQPVYLGPRLDRTLDACTTDQLKYRADVAEGDEVVESNMPMAA